MQDSLVCQQCFSSINHTHTVQFNLIFIFCSQIILHRKINLQILKERYTFQSFCCQEVFYPRKYLQSSYVSQTIKFTIFLFESFTPGTGTEVMKFEQFMKFYLHIVTTNPVGLPRSICCLSPLVLSYGNVIIADEVLVI